MTTRALVYFICVSLVLACSMTPGKSGTIELQQQVTDTERAFARTMVDRDFNAFKSFLSDEAVFFSGTSPMEGKQRIAEAWKPYYEKPDAPFSWEPERVVVLDSGTLALSTGPVSDANGNLTGTFTSIWRLDSSGQWQIIFDKGNKACDCAKP